MAMRVIVLTTGGTIGHRSSGGVAVMDFNPSSLASAVGLIGIDIEFRAIFAKGSMDIATDDWVILAEAIAAAATESPRGIVVLHGTDTLQYTAAALSFMLSGLYFPLVLTGSMLPGGDTNSDALANLRDAVRVAALADMAEVCVVFSADAERSRGTIIRGTRARKVHSLAIDAFASVNAAPIGSVEGEHLRMSSPLPRPRGSGPLRLATELDRDVVLVKLTPAVTPAILARHLQGASGAVIEGTGIGHIKSDLQGVVAAFGRPVVITTQAVYGGERLGRYAADRAILEIPNIIPTADMTSETALVKLMWALKQAGDVRAIMRSNIAGEIAAPALATALENET